MVTVAGGGFRLSERTAVFLPCSSIFTDFTVKVIHGGLIGDGGEFLTEKMALSGVDISRIERTDGSNGHAIIQINKDGQNCILLHAGSNYQIDRKYIEDFLADSEENDILLLQNEISSLEEAFEIAEKKKLRIAFNPSPFKEDIKLLPLKCVKWFFCNEIEGEALFGSGDPETMKVNFLKNDGQPSFFLRAYEDSCFFAKRCCKPFIFMS